MGKTSCDPCEVWDLSPLHIPARSMLYALDPMGIGTPWGECLTSYIARLAAAHCVFPGVLMNRMVDPLIQGKDRRLVHIPQNEKTQLFNATGRRATLGVQIFETLTRRRDLCHLTFLAWTDVLFIRGLMRSTKAWCSLCYQEWRDSGLDLYDPLIWQTQPVTMCLRHGAPLSHYCPNPQCGRSLPALGWRSYPGYCTYCHQWLGGEPDSVLAVRATLSETEFAWQQWVTEQMSTLVTLSPTLSIPPSKRHASETLRFFYQQIFKGSSTAFARTLKLPISLVSHWFCRGTFPQMDMLLRICYGLGLSLDDFLLQDAATLQPCLRKAYEPAPDESRAKWARDIQEMKQALEDILTANAFPPPSLAEVAKQLRHDVHVLSRWHPLLCQAISARYKEYAQQKTRARMQRYREEMRTVAVELHAKGLSLTRGHIGPFLPQPGILRNPKLRQLLEEVCREIEEGS